MNPLKVNPRISRLVCSRTGKDVSSGGFRAPLGLCGCCDAPGSPLLVRYRLEEVHFESDWDGSRRQGIWKYEALLPVLEPWPGYAADVGLTAIARQEGIGSDLQVDLWTKMEGANPSGSFKDRGLAVAIALGRACGAPRFCLPTQGNAGVAAALFCSRMKLPPCIVYMPEHYTNSSYHHAARHFGAHVHFHGDNIAACGRKMRADLSGELARGEIVDLSTFSEPGRLEGKKTMGLEIFEQFRGVGLPDYVIYPTGGGTGLLGISKAFQELVQLGHIGSGERLPRMVAVQSEQCAPIVRSFHAGHDHVTTIQSLGTVAAGLDVPGAIMGHEILRVLRDSEGTAVDVTEMAITDAYACFGHEGISSGYEGAATLAALQKLRSTGDIGAGSRVLLLLTSSHTSVVAHR